LLFHTYTFLLFFIIFIAFYAATGKNLRLQNLVLLVFSYLFYAGWDERFLILIAGSTACDYIAGLGMARLGDVRRRACTAAAAVLGLSVVVLLPSFGESGHFLALVAAGTVAFLAVVFILEGRHWANRRRHYLTLSIVLNLGLLGVFKYFDFFARSLFDLGQAAGITIDDFTLNVVLPVGISFYTFQTMSYTIDVYRKRIPATENIVQFAAFVAFFPQLVAGPIERAAHLLPQFAKRRQLTWDNFQSGATLFTWGLFKKAVVADHLAAVSDKVFANPEAYSSGDIVVALIAFTFQIYGDFSGYSDMARGIGRILGFDIMLNFNLPYIARTPSEFWRRWHMSLSTWLRDYLYIGLGGNRHGTFNTYRNLALTMLLGGLWHGANWTFVFWGAYQGLLLVIYRMLHIDDHLAALNARGGSSALAGNLIAWGVMFVLIVFGWLLFRATSIDHVMRMLEVFTMDISLRSALWLDIGRVLLPLFFIQALQISKKQLEVLPALPVWLRYHVGVFVLWSVLFGAARGTREFIYFDF